MAYLIQNPRPTLVQQHEVGTYNSGVWCSLPGYTNRAGYSVQFCPTLLQQQYQAESVSTATAGSSSTYKTCTKALSALHRAIQARPIALAALRPLSHVWQ